MKNTFGEKNRHEKSVIHCFTFKNGAIKIIITESLKLEKGYKRLFKLENSPLYPIRRALPLVGRTDDMSSKIKFAVISDTENRIIGNGVSII